MKRLFGIICLMIFSIVSYAQVEFVYDAGAEIVSAYLWRGQYNGGLSFQPTISIGFNNEHAQFKIGAWANIGASDWKFQKGLEQYDDYNPNTYLIAEVDILGLLRIHGVTLGFNHFYYGNGPFINAGNIYKAMQGTSQTEINIGIDGDDWLPEQHHIYCLWNTIISGRDENYIYNEDDEIVGAKRAFSSYLEIGYDYCFSKYDLTLGAQLGIVPWRSNYTYGTNGVAFKCVSLKLNKAWTFDICELDLFVQSMIDPYSINKENAYINASGDDKCNFLI